MSKTQRLSGIELIRAERERQIALGYDADHDDGHTDGSILDCARRITNYVSRGETPSIEWYERVYRHKVSWQMRRAVHVARKYPDPIDRLRIAGALIAAEIERLQRLNERSKR